MKFKIVGVQKNKRYSAKNGNYTYWIQGEGRLALLDLIPYMLEVSKHSKDYALNGEFEIVDKRTAGIRMARFRLEATLDCRLNRVHVFDNGIGTQMIDKFMRSVENSVE